MARAATPTIQFFILGVFQVEGGRIYLPLYSIKAWVKEGLTLNCQL